MTNGYTPPPTIGMKIAWLCLAIGLIISPFNNVVGGVLISLYGVYGFFCIIASTTD